MTNEKPRLCLPVGNKSYTEAAVIIVGAGFSEIRVVIDLLKTNKWKIFVILEMSSGLGVWSHLYSYSFEQNPDWIKEHSGQEEVLECLVGVAQKSGLYQYIRFNSSEEECEWNDVTQKWNIGVRVSGEKDAEFNSSYSIKSDFLVSAVGHLNVPQLPSIPGLLDYQGKLMHSAYWDWTYGPKGKNIAVIGVGSTSTQIVPEVAKFAKYLTVYQRNPNRIAPRKNSPIPMWERMIYKYLHPYIWRYKRAQMMNYREKTFGSLVVSTPQNADNFEVLCEAHMKRQLPGQNELWDKLLPVYKIVASMSSLPMTFILSSYERIQNWRLFDLITLATGLRATDFMCNMKITGRDGRSISTVWKDGAEALNGICVESLPNFGMMYGPNTNMSHNSIILMIEAQSRYINALIEGVMKVREAGGRVTIEPNPREYGITTKGSKTNYYASPDCNSWYKISESGKVTNN
ncbi:uncharacterized protein N7479_011137 [Penicillium vulpinum]|uniref:FAD/NAD(P)-binding domain-containing protein n=1 Tax=Penicillium vulpinum TaxID=29845 RepID=A0A1V6RSG8_9EURO|nr:uncharacterized protein N7479_011137 [Penicillium vulpinum]KAJ5952724.1 hypothetical protein N7479_011137 [Penicillium vulpinum]OQE04429.1 hypothetical protein PENVUL_c033G10229 [Penicillium vulpinum]